jgi:cytochrome P450
VRTETLAAVRPIGDLTGPVGDRWSGNLADFETDRLGFLLRVRDQFGGLVRFDSQTTIVNDPHLAAEILLDRRKSFAIRENFRGETLTRAEIAETKWLRPALNPGMRRGRAGAITDEVRSCLSRELLAASGTAFDPLPLLERVSSHSVATFFFGSDAPRVVEPTRELLASLDRVFGNAFSLPAGWPTPSRRRIRRAHRALEQVLLPLLHARARETGSPQDDVATRVVQALSARAAGPSPARVAQLLIGGLLAAQRVPAAGAAWMLYEVAQDPGLQERLRSEATRYAGMAGSGRTPDARGYPLAMGVVLESLRLHPPTWLLHRTLLRDEVIGTHAAPQGHHLLISPYVLHRDGSHFEDPETFSAIRWNSRHPPPAAFMPFGRGLHGCPGSEVGTAMLVAILLTTVDHYTVVLRGHGVRPDPRSTLVPAGLAVELLPR